MVFNDLCDPRYIFGATFANGTHQFVMIVTSAFERSGLCVVQTGERWKVIAQYSKPRFKRHALLGCGITDCRNHAFPVFLDSAERTNERVMRITPVFLLFAMFLASGIRNSVFLVLVKMHRAKQPLAFLASIHRIAGFLAHRALAIHLGRRSDCHNRCNRAQYGEIGG